MRPLAEERWAPLQVVTREGWAGADDLVAAAEAAVRAVAPVPAGAAPVRVPPLAEPATDHEA